MAPPSDDTIVETLQEVVREEYRKDPAIVVNQIRKIAEQKLDLEGNFLKQEDWNARSKTVIRELYEKLESGEDEAVQEPADASKNGIKRQSSEESFPAPKRLKKPPAPAKKAKAKPKKEESESELSELADTTDDAPKKGKSKGDKKASRKEDSDSELSELDISEDEPKKRKPKKVATKGKAKKEESESDLSDLADSEEEPKKKKRGNVRKLKKARVEDEDQESSNFKQSSSGQKRKRADPNKKRTAKRTKVEPDSDDDLTDTKKEADEDGADTKPKVEEEAKPNHILTKGEDSDGDIKGAIEETKPSIADDSDSELSSLIDDGPPKRKGRKSKEPAAKGAPKKAKGSAVKEVTGDEAEIKKLQGQLVKCGVRKIWGIELKKCDGSRDKIRHLRNMLRDVGMDGRFSEAKAREIKEKRELMGELEAVNEMNELWGLEGRGHRASRSRGVKKSLKEESDDDEVKTENDEDDDEEPETKANSRVSKRMADLAFLGDDSES
ncbi:hypothetical protein F5Y15DRAFT_381783, partial [Xylariaceae sp. FL0016]